MLFGGGSFKRDEIITMPTLVNKYYPLRTIVFFLGEGALIFSSLLIVDWVMLGPGLFFLDLLPNSFRAILVTIIFQLCLYFFDQYDLRNEVSLINTFTRMTLAFGVGCILLGGVYYSIPFMIISTRIFWLGYLVICLSVALWRGAYNHILRKRLFVQNILLVGTGALASDIAREIEGVQDSVYRVRGFVGDTKPAYNPHNAPVRASLDDFEELLSTQDLERIIVALDNPRGATPITALLNAKLRGITIEQSTTFYERITGKILVERIAPSWIIFSDGFSLSRWKYHVKRFIDLLFSAVLLVITLPVLLITAILIKMESPGPIFYLQERVGQGNRIFKIIKFRSMRQDAEKNGAVWAKVNDDRVTRVGEIIRRLRIDELPQLWNVMKGEMSLVGPRPERKIFVDELEKKIPYYSIRHTLKPGVTGWAQVCYPYGASELDALKKLEYDLYYLKNVSIALDLLVIFKTVKTVLFKKGSR
ncbi:TIGR03013 family PEP-CTERM/XrtA system glycosyltransferase [Desulfopila sp. IMCC35006]|nr:TIGR03013 family PEP-CTERM/XrtA system glycosyltransferase [Desulfopila sp. IMCC35006]